MKMYHSLDWFDFISTRDWFSITLFMVWFHHLREIDLWRCILFSRRSLFHGLVRLTTSAVHFHSFRFAGGSLTAAALPFSENVVFITLSIGLISYRREIVSWRCRITLFLVWFHHLREIDLWRCISIWIPILSTFIISWLGSAYYNPPSIFTLFASPVEVLRPRPRSIISPFSSPHSIIPLKHFSLSYMWVLFLHIHSFFILTLFLWFTFLHYLMIKLILFFFFTIYITLVSLM